jgi:hypothetical protein
VFTKVPRVRANAKIAITYSPFIVQFMCRDRKLSPKNAHTSETEEKIKRSGGAQLPRVFLKSAFTFRNQIVFHTGALCILSAKSRQDRKDAPTMGPTPRANSELPRVSPSSEHSPQPAPDTLQVCNRFLLSAPPRGQRQLLRPPSVSRTNPSPRP